MKSKKLELQQKIKEIKRRISLEKDSIQRCQQEVKCAKGRIDALQDFLYGEVVRNIFTRKLVRQLEKAIERNKNNFQEWEKVVEDNKNDLRFLELELRILEGDKP